MGGERSEVRWPVGEVGETDMANMAVGRCGVGGGRSDVAEVRADFRYWVPANDMRGSSLRYEG